MNGRFPNEGVIFLLTQRLYSMCGVQMTLLLQVCSQPTIQMGFRVLFYTPLTSRPYWTVLTHH